MTGGLKGMDLEPGVHRKKSEGAFNKTEKGKGGLIEST